MSVPIVKIDMIGRRLLRDPFCSVSVPGKKLATDKVPSAFSALSGILSFHLALRSGK